MTLHCQLCHATGDLYENQRRDTGETITTCDFCRFDPFAVRTCSVCRFPRLKEFRSVQPPKDLVPAMRVGEVSNGTQADDVLVCIRPPAEHDVTGGEWELRKADKAG